MEYKARFDGSFVYLIRDKRTQGIAYVGQTGNFMKRYGKHFYDKKSDSGFSNWCEENGEDKSNFEMVILDLSDYEEIDLEDRLILEKMLILYHEHTIVNKRIPGNLDLYEKERFEQISNIIDFEFRSYLSVKLDYLNKKKDLSAGTEKPFCA